MHFLLKPIIGVALNGGILYFVTKVVEDISYTGGIKFFILGGLVLGVVNAVARPLLKLITSPLIFLTGGLFLVVLNIATLWFLQWFLQVAQFQDVTLTFPSLSSYVIGAVVFGIINWASHLIIK
ncbi:MAG: phage holin family protein [Candidatus Peregrinibacteria bacterium]